MRVHVDDACTSTNVYFQGRGETEKCSVRLTPSFILLILLALGHPLSHLLTKCFVGSYSFTQVLTNLVSSLYRSFFLSLTRARAHILPSDFPLHALEPYSTTCKSYYTRTFHSICVIDVHQSADTRKQNCQSLHHCSSRHEDQVSDNCV